MLLNLHLQDSFACSDLLCVRSVSAVNRSPVLSIASIMRLAPGEDTPEEFQEEHMLFAEDSQYVEKSVGQVLD